MAYVQARYLEPHTKFVRYVVVDLDTSEVVATVMDLTIAEGLVTALNS